MHTLMLTLTLQVITRPASMRVAEYAFQYARDNGRKRVTAVHKAVRLLYRRYPRHHCLVTLHRVGYASAILDLMIERVLALLQNIMKLADGLFIRCAREVAEK